MANSQAQTLVGAWSDWNYGITKETKGIFDKAFKGFVGVGYKPVCFATQVVNGTNYAFLCEATMTDRMATKFIAMVHIHVRLDGHTAIQSIRTLDPFPNSAPGGFKSWEFTVSKDAQKSFEEAMTLLGVSYELEAFTTQVVAGINYVFLAKASPTVQNPKPYAAMISVYQPLPGQGKAQLNEIKKIQA